MPGRIAYHRPSGQSTKREATREYNSKVRDPALLKLYSRSHWRKFREWIKADRILCERCKSRGLTVLGDHVHHVVDPRDNADLTYSEDNVELLCHGCHSSHHISKRRE